MTVLIGAILALVGAIEIWNHLLTPNQKKTAGNLLSNFYAGALDVAQPLLTAVEGELQPIASAFLNAFKKFGGPIAETVRQPIADVAKSAFTLSAAGLATQGESTPANALDTASTAFADAFGFGISSAVVTAAFEAAFPEKLNTLNGVGPMLANMAGFEEVTKAVLDPLYKNAFGRSLEYHFRSVFKPELPDESDAVTWHSRRLLTDDQLRTIFSFSGLKAEYEQPFVESAYRAVQPRALASLYQDVEFDTARVVSMLQFAGIRDADVNTLVDGFKLASVRNVRNQYVAGVARAAELGVLTDPEVDADLTDLGFSAEARHWVKLTIATRKLEQLAELYRKSISEAYAFGNITDADYVNALQAIGISHADAQAHYAIDSIKKHGQEARAIARAAAAEQKVIDRAMVEAARADYHAGIVDDVALAARLAAAQVPALAIPFAVEVEIQKAKARRRLVFGVLLPPDAALQLRERVAALKEQRIKKLIDDPATLAQLTSWGIPAQNAADLVAQWAAQASKTLRSIP